jgi:hypothetical protein
MDKFAEFEGSKTTRWDGSLMPRILPVLEKYRNWGYPTEIEVPDSFYHATTAMSAILASGKLLSRSKLGKTAGLGGGSSESVSFTGDPRIASAIYRSMVEAVLVARNEISTAAILTRTAKRLSDGLYRVQFLSIPKDQDGTDHAEQTACALVHGYEQKSSFATPVSQIKGKVDPRIGWDGKYERITNYWYVAMNAAEVADTRFDLWRKFMSLCEHEHPEDGCFDPLFWCPDILKFAETRLEDIGVIEADIDPLDSVGLTNVWKDVPRGMIHRMGSLDEYRTYHSDDIVILSASSPDESIALAEDILAGWSKWEREAADFIPKMCAKQQMGFLFE